VANGLIDPVYAILPNKKDFIRRSSDPTGTLGSLSLQKGRLTFAGKSLTLRRSLPFVSPGRLTISSKVFRIHRTRPITRGHLTVGGKGIGISLPPPSSAQWVTIPDFVLNRAVAFPQFVPNIRVNYLVDPSSQVTSVTLINVDLANLIYDSGNDRINLSVAPSGDTGDALKMRATTSGGLQIDSNTFVIYAQTLPTNALAGVQLFDSAGNSLGYGGSNDPQGAFLGQTGFGATDVWWPESVPEGDDVVPLAGGSFQITVP
jgi:hypothetical protein